MGGFTLNLVNTPLQPVSETCAQFAAMERSAGVVFGVMFVCSAACIALYRPNLWFIFGSVLAGGAVYWCWLATLWNKFGIAAVAALLSVTIALLTAVTEFSRPLPVLLCSGMSLLGVGLYASILIGKTFKQNAQYKV